MKSKAIFGLFAFAVVSFGFVALTAQTAQADDHKVTICHATNSHKNPYTTNTVSKSSVDELKNKYLNGHGDHIGPVWYEGIADHSWGDIIPPFVYNKPNGGTTTYPGYNWTAEGQAFYNNNCNELNSTEPNYCDTTQVTGSVASWLTKNSMNGADCFDYAVEQRCGYLNVTITDQPQPGYATSFRAVYTLNGLVASPYTNFPAVFAEDFNGGSVDVTWFTVGPEKDWLIDTTFPNFWSNVGRTITVDTDCEGESTPAVIKAAVKCATYQDQAKIELTLTNRGETAGEVSVNGKIVNVPAESSVVSYFDSKTNVKVVDGEEVILDQTLDCTPGQGGGGTTPETSKTPEVPESPKSPESPIVLPNTFGASTPLVASGALSFASLILVAGTAIKSRLLA